MPAAPAFAPVSDQQTGGDFKHWLVLSQAESLPSQLLASSSWVLYQVRTSAGEAAGAGCSCRVGAWRLAGTRVDVRSSAGCGRSHCPLRGLTLWPLLAPPELSPSHFCQQGPRWWLWQEALQTPAWCCRGARELCLLRSRAQGRSGEMWVDSALCELERMKLSYWSGQSKATVSYALRIPWERAALARGICWYLWLAPGHSGWHGLELLRTFLC